MTIEDIKELRAHYESNDAIAKICDYLIEKEEKELILEMATVAATVDETEQ